MTTTLPKTPHLNSKVFVRSSSKNEILLISSIDKDVKEVSIDKLIEWLSEMKVIADGETLVKLAAGDEQYLTGAYLTKDYVCLSGSKL